MSEEQKPEEAQTLYRVYVGTHWLTHTYEEGMEEWTIEKETPKQLVVSGPRSPRGLAQFQRTLRKETNIDNICRGGGRFEMHVWTSTKSHAKTLLRALRKRMREYVEEQRRQAVGILAALDEKEGLNDAARGNTSDTGTV